MDLDNSVIQQEQPDNAASAAEPEANAVQEPASDSIVTSDGVVSRRYVESLIKKNGGIDKKNGKSVGKRILSWFFGIIGCLAFLFVCICLCSYVFRYVNTPRNESSPGSFPSFDEDFFVIPDDGNDSDDSYSSSDSDIYLEPSQTSNAGLGIVVSPLEVSTAQNYGISGGLVILGITENSSFTGTDVREYDMITAAGELK